MDQVSVSDARNRLGALLDRVECGREIIITRHGKPIARLVPALESDRPAATVANLRALRSSIAKRGATLPWSELRTFRDEGHR